MPSLVDNFKQQVIYCMTATAACWLLDTNAIAI